VWKPIWDLSESTTVEEVVKLLRNRFGVINQAERFRAELRQRRRQPNESWQELYRSVCRLMALAYPGPSSDLSNIVARDAFLDALGDHSLRIRILEKEPENLKEALKLACKLEAYGNSARVDEGANTSKTGRAKEAVKSVSCWEESQDVSACDKNSVVMKQLQESLADCCSQMSQMRRDMDGLRQQVCSAVVPAVQAAPPSYAAPQSFGMGPVNGCQGVGGTAGLHGSGVVSGPWGPGALCRVSGPGAAAWPYGPGSAAGIFGPDTSPGQRWSVPWDGDTGPGQVTGQDLAGQPAPMTGPVRPATTGPRRRRREKLKKQGRQEEVIETGRPHRPVGRSPPARPPGYGGRSPSRHRPGPARDRPATG